MLVIILTLGTLCSAAWFWLLGMTNTEDWKTCAYNRVLDNLIKMDKLRAKYAEKSRPRQQMFSFNPEKKIAGLEARNRELQKGNLKSLGIFDMPGYVLMRKFEIVGKGNLHKMIFAKNFELYGKKHAENKTAQLLARIFSYPLIGISLALIIGVSVMGFGKTEAGMGIAFAGTALVLVSVYAMYDELGDRIKKRREAIISQFPNMASKLALLVTSGMVMEKAWKETAYSQKLELYKEMQKTSEELDNLVGPEEAWGEFIRRCSTKETSKLASAIIQNLSKGNAEISHLLKAIAKEAWLERKHNAKREADKAGSRLMIPTILLFLAILLMIMAPVLMNLTVL
ncbi:MAG: type II secretion system F family protein [Oscillospiraceae bacterium]|nr:type II secretion system F family protein [Oscillospiraceae bacterium]